MSGYEDTSPEVASDGDYIYDVCAACGEPVFSEAEADAHEETCPAGDEPPMNDEPRDGGCYFGPAYEGSRGERAVVAVYVVRCMAAIGPRHYCTLSEGHEGRHVWPTACPDGICDGSGRGGEQ